MTDPIRILLADDHALVRAGLRAIIADEPDFALVGEATSGDEARDLCAALRPDVLLLDLRMPGPPATETIPWVRAHRPATRIVILTAHREDAWVRGLLDLGAAGYVLKDDALEAVPQAVRAVAAGGTWLSQAIMPALLRPPADADAEALTPREREVLALVAAGRSNKDIGLALGVSVRTAEFHVKHLLDKLRARSRAEAVAVAHRRKLLADDPPADTK